MMRDSQYQKNFETALETLQNDSSDCSAWPAEKNVWADIAARGSSRSRGRRFIDPFQIPLPLAASFAIGAIICGVTLGFSQATSYGKQASRSMEQRYVESIHPVLMSATHSEHDH